MFFVACEQLLRGGKRKESLQLCRWNLNICIEKSMQHADTFGACFHAFFNVCLHSRSFPLHANWRISDSSVDREPGNWRRNSNSREVVANSPSFSRSAARAPRRACSQVMLLVPQTLKVNETLLELISFKTSCKHDSNSSSHIDTRISID